MGVKAMLLVRKVGKSLPIWGLAEFG